MNPIVHVKAAELDSDVPTILPDPFDRAPENSEKFSESSIYIGSGSAALIAFVGLGVVARRKMGSQK